jgi:hypothetical protein
MSDWMSMLNGDATDWLLEESNPSVRYFTQRWLLDLPENDPQVSATVKAIARSAPVQNLLSHQRPEGNWGSDSRPHQGTKRFLSLLMWLGYQGNAHVDKAMDYLVNGCLQDNGAYAIEHRDRLVELPCHGADLLRLMIWSRYRYDQRTERLLAWLVDIQGDDGIWPCLSKLQPFSCLWATVGILRAYKDLPARWITTEVETSRRFAMEQILNSNLYRYGKGPTSSRWFEFGFPLLYDTDILELLELLAPFVSPEDEQIQAGLSLVLEKQQPDGCWLCEKHPKGGQWMNKFIDLEEIGKPSKWVTLHSMKMLKTLFGRGT